MTAYDDLLEWARGRPWWQQKALARIISGETLGQRDFEAIANSLFQEPELPVGGDWFAELTPMSDSKDEPVRILAVRKLENVNRLASGQELTFKPDGITVVFGNNGSGKSGYARVIRSMVRTRHHTDILPDVFSSTTGQQLGEVLFTVGSREDLAQLGQSASPELSRVAFYDKHCGDTYLNTETGISYRPAAVQLLDDLTTVCVGVRDVISVWKEEVSHPGPLPDVDMQGSAATFLESLNASTTDEAINSAVECPADIGKRLVKKEHEIALLKATDLTQEKARLNNVATALQTVVRHILNLDKALGKDAQDQLSELSSAVHVAQSAADLVSRDAFSDEPLSEVGSQAWQMLWSAAEKYSTIVYPDHPFPHIGEGAVCVLCQQSLSHDASVRLDRFRQFVAGTATREAEDAQCKLKRFRDNLEQQIIEPNELSLAIATIKQRDADIGESIKLFLKQFENRKMAMLTGKQTLPINVDAFLGNLKTVAANYRNQAAAVNADGFAKQLAEAESEERQLRDQIAMRDGRHLVKRERDRLQKMVVLDSKLAEVNTRSITEKASELTRKYVTEEASAHFDSEVEKFGLEHVTFKATKARQGVLLHKADLVNANPGSKLVDVLSEGEQTALGFAGFLTEVHFDTSKSAVVFDDPVSSLDHMKSESVAKRIVELAKERQVVVFTHDIAFTMYLYSAASEANVLFETRGIERRRQQGPGYTTLHHPWTAKNAAQRIDTLGQEVAALRREEAGMNDEEYLRKTECISGHMSETWERIISQVLAEPLVDFRNLEVRVGKLRVVGRLTEEDVKIYDDSYSRISRWASRHDTHPALNYTPPSVQQLTDEIGVLNNWFQKVKKYQA